MISNASFNVDGTYWLKIDPKTQEIISQNFKEFDIDFITQNMKKRQEKKAKRKEAKGKEVELFSYDLDEIIFDNSGGAVLIGEQYFITTSTSTDSNGRTRTTYRYHYNDIIVVKISSDGNIDWAEKIPKVQVSTNDGGVEEIVQLATKIRTAVQKRREEAMMAITAAASNNS